MKFLVHPQPQPPVENILFPHKQFKLYQPKEENLQSSLSLGSLAEFPMIQAKKKLHLLEITQPHLLLQKIFQPCLLLVKVLGCQPLKIENGKASFTYCSWNVAYSLLIFGCFMYDTFFFFPIMKYMNGEQEKNFLIYVTQIFLVVSQIFAAQMSYIFIAIRAKRIAAFWNRMQAVLIKIVARCPSHLDLLPSYKTARIKVFVWVMFTVVFGACYIVSFQDDIRKYLTAQNYNPAYHWFMFGGFTFYSVVLSIHILHSTCLTTFICVLCSCFKTLGRVALKQDGQGTMRNSQSPVLFEEVTEIYEELLELKRLVGTIFGLYVGMEILAMMICTTINFFFIISNPSESSLFCLNLAIAMPYLIWFHGLCATGEQLNYSMKKCYWSVRKAVASAVKKVSISEFTRLQIDSPEGLTAGGYFFIDMRLFTTVIGTIATYLVVTLQFGTGMNMKLDGSHLSKDSWGANIANDSN